MYRQRASLIEMDGKCGKEPEMVGPPIKQSKVSVYSTTSYHMGTAGSIDGRSEVEQQLPRLDELEEHSNQTASEPIHCPTTLNKKVVREYNEMLQRMLDNLKLCYNSANDEQNNLTEIQSERLEDWDDYFGSVRPNYIELELEYLELQYSDLSKCISAGVRNIQLRLAMEGWLKIQVNVSTMDECELKQLEFLSYPNYYTRTEVVEFSLAEIKRLERKQIVDSIAKVVRYEGPSYRHAEGLVVVQLERALGANYYHLEPKMLVDATPRILDEFAKIKMLAGEYHLTEEVLPDETLASAICYDLCHYCRYLLPVSSLKHCQYNSRKRIPESLEEGDALLVKKIFETNHCDEPGILKSFIRYYVNNNAYRHNEPNSKLHYLCRRKFCESCLKDIAYSGLYCSDEESCAYCQGVCNCQRCLLNDSILKLATIYTTNDGDVLRMRKYSSFVTLLSLEQPNDHSTANSQSHSPPLKRAKLR